MRGRLGSVIVFGLAACAAPETPARGFGTSAPTEVATASAGTARPSASATVVRTATSAVATPTASAPIATRTSAAPAPTVPTVRTAVPATATVAPSAPSPTQAATTGGIVGLVVWGSTPVSGLKLEVKPGGLFDGGPRTVAATVTSDAQGRFRAGSLAPGTYTVFADRTGTPYVANQIPTVEVSAGSDATATIYMIKPLALLTPAHEATVGVSATFTWEQIPGTTRYELYLLEVGATCTVPIFSNPSTTVATTSAATVTLAAGKHYSWSVKAMDTRSDLAFYNGMTRCVFVR